MRLSTILTIWLTGKIIPEDVPFSNAPENASIQVINLKNTELDAFIIVETGDDILYAPYSRRDGYFTWWNHWPVNNVESFGRGAKDASYVSHTSLNHIWIEGKNNFFAEGELVAVGNGNPISHESYHATQRKLFNGYCLGIVRSTKNAGSIKLLAASPGLVEKEIEINSIK